MTVERATTGPKTVARGTDAGASLRVAVVGAGVAGLACARELSRRGAKVTVFEKSRGPGGRAATRLTDFGSFDHGAQYFTVQHHRFEVMAQKLVEQGASQPWAGRMIAFSDGVRVDKSDRLTRSVAVPGMSGLGRWLAEGVDVRLNARVMRLEQRAGRWVPRDESGKALSIHGFDAVAVAMPSPQAFDLMRGHTDLTDAMTELRWEPCWAALLALGEPTGADFDGAFINDDPMLGWIARDSSKPHRAAVAGVAERWVVHANPRWSRAYLDMDEGQAAQWLARALAARLAARLMPRYLAAHRWRYATPTNPLTQPCLWDAPRRIGAAGDWCGGSRVEGAYLSGLALADAIVGN